QTRVTAGVESISTPSRSNRRAAHVTEIIQSGRTRVPRPSPGRQPGFQPGRSRLYDLLERRPVADDQRRSFELQQLFPLEFREQPAHSFARGADDLRDLFVRQRHLYLRVTVSGL